MITRVYVLRYKDGTARYTARYSDFSEWATNEPDAEILRFCETHRKTWSARENCEMYI